LHNSPDPYTADSEATPDTFVVETPENIRFGYDVADIGSRFLAISIDSLIQGALYFILFVATVIVASNLVDVSLPGTATTAIAVMLILTVFVIQFGYFMAFEIILNGQTPGKRLFNLRVIKDNGYPLATMDGVVRNLVRIIDFFPIFYGVGIITMFFNGRAKRLGDFAAGTIVVKMRSEVKLRDLVAVSSLPPASGVKDVAGVERLTAQDLQLATSFLERRNQLQSPDALTIQVARHLAIKMGSSELGTSPTPSQALVFIRQTLESARTRSTASNPDI